MFFFNKLISIAYKYNTQYLINSYETGWVQLTIILKEVPHVKKELFTVNYEAVLNKPNKTHTYYHLYSVLNRNNKLP